MCTGICEQKKKKRKNTCTFAQWDSKVCVKDQKTMPNETFLSFIQRIYETELKIDGTWEKAYEWINMFCWNQSVGGV